MNAINRQIALLEALPNIDEADSAADLSFAIQVLQNHYSHVIERQELAEDLDARNELVDELNAKLKQTVTGLETALKQRGEFEAECKKMLNLYTAEKHRTDATHLKLDRINAGLLEELKTLRAMNPQRLDKQVKALQKKAKEQTDANAKQRETINLLKKANKDYTVVAASNIKLRQEIQLLDAALIEAGKDISDGNRIKPLHEMGDWAIYPDETDGKIIVVDKTTDAARTYTLANKISKIRPVPAKVAAKCEAVLTELLAIRANLESYQEAS